MEDTKVREISLEEYEAFTAGKDISALQMAGQARRIRLEGQPVRLFALEKGQKTELAMLVKINPAMKLFKTAYSPRGWVVQDENSESEENIRTFLEGMAQILKKDNVILIQAESSKELRQRDADGNIVEGGWDNMEYRQMLTKAGCIPSELTTGYDVVRNRWASILDLEENGKMLTEAQVLDRFSRTARYEIRQAQKPWIKVRQLAKDELHLLDEMERSSASKHGFAASDLKVYEDLQEGYGENCQVLYAWLDVPGYEQELTKEKAKTEAELRKAIEAAEKAPDSKKKQNKVKTVQEHLDGLERKMDGLKELKARGKDELPLAASMFLTAPNETLYLFSGSDQSLVQFHGIYAVHWEMIRKTLARKAARYNFWGISGIFDPEDPSYGVYFFKKGLGARVAEYAGEFIWPINKTMTKVFRSRMG